LSSHGAGNIATCTQAQAGLVAPRQASESECKANRPKATGAILTNLQIADALFLSRHPVDFHLRQVFRRLEIHSRVQLTRLVVEWQSAED
jgi:DNA-binding CsgD family transcriptional regulator